MTSKLEDLQKKLEEIEYKEEDYRATNKFKVEKYVVVTSCIFDEDGIDVVFAVFDKDVDKKEVNLEFIEKNAIAFFKVCAENYYVTHFVRDGKVFEVLTNDVIRKLRRKSIEIIREREKKLEEIEKKYKEILKDKEYIWDLIIAVEKKLKEKYNISVKAFYDREMRLIIEKYLDEIILDVNKLVEHLADQVYKIIKRTFHFIKEEILRKASVWFDVKTSEYGTKYLIIELVAYDFGITLKDFINNGLIERLDIDIADILKIVKHIHIYFLFNVENEKYKLETFADLFEIDSNRFREYKYIVELYDKEKDEAIYYIATDRYYIHRILKDIAKLYNLDLKDVKIEKIKAYIESS